MSSPVGDMSACHMYRCGSSSTRCTTAGVIDCDGSTTTGLKVGTEGVELADCGLSDEWDPAEQPINAAGHDITAAASKAPALLSRAALVRTR
jgi:hypothetical protein